MWLAQRYGRPIIIAETGVGLPEGSTGPLDSGNRSVAVRDDASRIATLRNIWSEAFAALRDGADLRGIFHWSFLDNLEWGSGYGDHFGMVFVDHKTPRLQRTPKNSAWWFKGVIEQHGFVSGTEGPKLHAAQSALVQLLI